MLFMTVGLQEEIGDRTCADAFLRGDMLSCKGILLQRLEQMPTGGVLLQVEINENVGLVFKFHLQRPVTPGCELWNVAQNYIYWAAEAFVAASGPFPWLERRMRHFHNSL